MAAELQQNRKADRAAVKDHQGVFLGEQTRTHTLGSAWFCVSCELGGLSASPAGSKLRGRAQFIKNGSCSQ